MEDESKLKAGHAQAGNYYGTFPVHVSLRFAHLHFTSFIVRFVFHSKSRRHAHRAAQERQLDRGQELGSR